MENRKDMTMLVLSCDKYCDLWNDFFNLREKYWPDCPFYWYIVTESKDFGREGIGVIKCGKDLNWAGRYRKAVQSLNTPFLGVFLDDFFISDKIDNAQILSIISLMKQEHVSYVNMSNVYGSIIDMEDKEYFAEHMIRIPNHQRYGISTEAAIWDRAYLLKKLGDGDYSAWQFEIDRCTEADSKEGLGGVLLCDDRMPFHVSVTPVVIQGMFYPDALKEYKSKGYTINIGDRPIMPIKKVWEYKLKVRFSTIKRGRKLLRWLATHLLGMRFFAN